MLNNGSPITSLFSSQSSQSIIVHDSTSVCAHVALSACVVIAHSDIKVAYHQQHVMSLYYLYRLLQMVVKSLLVLFFCVFNRGKTRYDSELGVF